MLDWEQLESIPETLNQMRVQLGWTKRHLAEQSGFSYKQVLIWDETGYGTASYIRIKKVFQVMKQALEQQTQP